MKETIDGTGWYWYYITMWYTFIYMSLTSESSLKYIY